MVVECRKLAQKKELLIKTCNFYPGCPSFRVFYRQERIRLALRILYAGCPHLATARATIRAMDTPFSHFITQKASTVKPDFLILGNKISCLLKNWNSI